MLLDGKAFSEKVKSQLKNKVDKLRKNGIVPALAVIIVGDDPASKIYVKNKKKACEEIGIYSAEYAFKSDITQEELLEFISDLNGNKEIHGILTQLPLPKHIDPLIVAESISPAKDVDCFNEINIGKISSGRAKIFPCTPAGIIALLKENNIKIEGKACTIVGRSNIVGKPLSLMLLNENATITVCHSKTENLKAFCKQADILISAVGRPGLITEDMVKEDSIVVDVGMNRLSSGKLCGDVDFDKIIGKAKFITPVPGGVGPMTIAMLMKNLVTLTEEFTKR